MACAAPQSPMRMPSRLVLPWPARLIIEAMAATANAPFANPKAKTDALSGKAGAYKPPTASTIRAIAEARQPPTVHILSEPSTRPPMALAATATRIMPASTPPCCTPASWVLCPGVMPKTEPANGSRIKS